MSFAIRCKANAIQKAECASYLWSVVEREIVQFLLLPRSVLIGQLPGRRDHTPWSWRIPCGRWVQEHNKRMKMKASITYLCIKVLHAALYYIHCPCWLTNYPEQKGSNTWIQVQLLPPVLWTWAKPLNKWKRAIRMHGTQFNFSPSQSIACEAVPGWGRAVIILVITSIVYWNGKCGFCMTERATVFLFNF